MIRVHGAIWGEIRNSIKYKKVNLELGIPDGELVRPHLLWTQSQSLARLLVGSRQWGSPWQRSHSSQWQFWWGQAQLHEGRAYPWTWSRSTLSLWLNRRQLHHGGGPQRTSGRTRTFGLDEHTAFLFQSLDPPIPKRLGRTSISGISKIESIEIKPNVGETGETYRMLERPHIIPPLPLPNLRKDSQLACFSIGRTFWLISCAHSRCCKGTSNFGKALQTLTNFYFVQNIRLTPGQGMTYLQL